MVELQQLARLEAVQRSVEPGAVHDLERAPLADERAIPRHQ
jgi:hypothetical protein